MTIRSKSALVAGVAALLIAGSAAAAAASGCCCKDDCCDKTDAPQSPAPEPAN